MTYTRGTTLAKMAGILLTSVAAAALAPASAADVVLNGTITSAAGAKLEGVTVSAKLEGSTITTTVYTDESGNYYFPPLASGKYNIWAQALAFETTKSAVDTGAVKQANLVLAPMTDPEKRIRQLPAEMLVTALPEDTADDARIKKIFTNQCTGCHNPGYVLQFRFDEAGWNKVINMMKRIPAVFANPTAKPNAIIDYNQKALAAYLARARGPGESSMKFTARSRATGEAARATWTLYDLPLNPDVGIATNGVKYNPNDGTDWSLGTT
jgi:mono/diheme cytochrome c family protein